MKNKLKELRKQEKYTLKYVSSELGISLSSLSMYEGNADIQLTLNTYTHLLSGGTSPIKDYLARLIKS